MVQVLIAVISDPTPVNLSEVTTWMESKGGGRGVAAARGRSNGNPTRRHERRERGWRRVESLAWVTSSSAGERRRAPVVGRLGFGERRAVSCRSGRNLRRPGWIVYWSDLASVEGAGGVPWRRYPHCTPGHGAPGASVPNTARYSSGGMAPDGTDGVSIGEQAREHPE